MFPQICTTREGAGTTEEGPSVSGREKIEPEVCAELNCSRARHHSPNIHHYIASSPWASAFAFKWKGELELGNSATRKPSKHLEI